jgi:CCR4-NOT transcription complex subunit 1
MLYMELMDTIADKALTKEVLRTTYYYASALLESDRAITQTNERTLIKQLGTWLGLQTFAKNRPVLHVDMDLKAMIRDAYQRGRMIAVLPFVQKVLEGCKGSKVFKATNPMIAGILALLAEIHGMERLKLNISFVIEMTFKTFEVRLEDVLPSRALRDLPRQAMHNPDFSALPDAGKLAAGGAGAPLVAPGGPPPSLVPPAGMAGMPPGAGAPPGGAPGGPPDASPGKGMPPGGAAPAPGAGPPGAAGAASPGVLASMATADPGLFAKLHTFVVINPSLAGLAERLGLKRLVPLAVDRAIVEIMPPVVERSVTIACMTAYELVTKDYAVDPDEGRLRSAAHLMVSSLAGSLALVTCKEPLRVSLANQLRALLTGQMEAHVLEGALQVGGRGRGRGRFGGSGVAAGRRSSRVPSARRGEPFGGTREGWRP